MIKFKEYYHYLREGGAYGHMGYVYENLDLTFFELKEFFKNLISGNIDRVTEKVDGQNIFFTWNDIEEEPRYARNIGQIRKGGISLRELKQQFEGRQSIEKVFAEGGQQIYDALYKVDDVIRYEIFGAKGNRWVNAEIMHVAAPNVILYKGNHIVLHGMYEFDNKSNKVPIDRELFDRLTNSLKIELSNWKILGPIVHKITNYEGLRGPYEKFKQHIDQVISRAKIDDNNTIRDFVEVQSKSKFSSEMPDISGDVIDAFAKIVSEKERFNILSLKKSVDKKYHKFISNNLTQTNIRKLQGSIIAPLQLAVTTLSIEVLKDLSSILVLDNKSESDRIRNNVIRLIKLIHTYQDQYTTDRKELLAKELAKHSNTIDGLLSKFNSPIEGIVVEYPPGSGNIYKLTGAFSTINQILGLGHYGRGAIPPVKADSVLDSNLNDNSI